MKKIKLFLVATIVLFLFPIMTNAASGTVRVTGSSTAVVGNQVKVTVTLSSATAIGSWNLSLNYNKSYLQLVSSSAEAGGTIMANSSSGTKSKSYTFTFKALKSGTTNVSIGSYEAYAYADLSEMKLSVNTLSMKIMTQQELEATYSKDNNLKELKVDGYELTPAFDKDTLEYNLSIPSDVTKVNIVATKNDNTASVTGDGEKEVVEGKNQFEIIVTAQNGSEKKYILNIEVEDLNPITTTINGEEYTIIKRKDILTKPDAYEEQVIMINNIEVPAFHSEITKFTLVGLKDNTGKIVLAIYNEEENTYTIYNEIKANVLTLYFTDFPKAIEGYTKTSITIHDIEVPAYVKTENNRFAIVYGMSIESGEYNYYKYDTEEKTFQVWDNSEVDALKKDLETYKYACIVFGGGLLLAFILIICLLSGKKNKNKKNKKKELADKKKEKQNEEKKQQDENKKIDIIDKRNIDSKEEIKEEKAEQIKEKSANEELFGISKEK